MSREMKIVNGPSFRHLAHGTGLFDDNNFNSVFTMDQEIPCRHTIQEKKTMFQMLVYVIGRINRKDQNLFLVLATKNGDHDGPGKGTWYYVMHYDVQTRQGQATEYNKEEFFASSVVREMFKAK